jgi:pimeloyl-ACP methyl ester carboxylesterase
MPETEFTFRSGPFRLAAELHVPDDLAPGERRPAFIILHGFGGSMKSSSLAPVATLLQDHGYVTLRFDRRGCGHSEGEPGYLICLEHVEDIRNAITAIEHRPEVDAKHIAIIGSSFGGALAIHTAAVDTRVAAVVSSSGWGNGERKFRGQHPTPEAWAKFTAMLEEGRRHRERTGKSLMVPRFDIVPIPGHLQGELTKKRKGGSLDFFAAETAQSMYDFKAEEVIDRIAPRPVLLMHAARDSVTPTEQSVEMFKRAGQPTELHLFAGADHFMLGTGNPRIQTVLKDWLARYFPARTAVAAE